MGYTVSAASMSVVCECVSNKRRDASTTVHERRMPQTKPNMEMENGIQQRSAQQNTELHYGCLLLFTAATAVLLL